jgi:hypothetical protein
MLRVSLCNATCERDFHLYCIALHFMFVPIMAKNAT